MKTMKTKKTISAKLKQLVFIGLLLSSSFVNAQSNTDPVKLVQEYYKQLNGLPKNQEPDKIIELLTDDFSKLEFTDSLENSAQFKETLGDIVENNTLRPNTIKFYKVLQTTKKIVEENYAVIICMVSPRGTAEGLSGLDVYENQTFVLKKINNVWKIQLLYINKIDIG